jgi:hypothetical protein
MLGNAALTPTAVLTTKRRADHTKDAEVGLVKLPEADEFIDDSLLFSNAVKLGHKAWIEHHASDVEIRACSQEHGE